MEEMRIERVFKAPLEKVWEAWTNPELVKKWWGPEGFYSPSIKIDFRVGGKCIYAMHGPAGSQWDRDMYSSGIYQEIEPMKKIVTTDYFSDENGDPISPTAEGQAEDFPTEMRSTVLFEALDENNTKLTILYAKTENEAQFEAMKKSGMVEGWNSSLDKFAAMVEA